MEIQKTVFQVIDFDKSTSVIKNFWTLDTAQMTESDFKEEIVSFENAIKKYRPQLILGVITDLRFPISVDLQTWIANGLFQTIATTGVKKYAVIVSKDILVQLSAEQTIEEDVSQAFVTKYFDNEDTGLGWLLK